MSSIFKELCKNNIIYKYPQFLKNSIHYECLMGSIAYGVSENISDIDIYGYVIPPKKFLFPYSCGYLYFFDNNIPKFEQYQQHHIKHNNNIYDITLYNIVKYFKLCANNNPNIIDSLYVPNKCVLFMSPIGIHVRSRRNIFLSKKIYHTFKGYAFSQLHKIEHKMNKIFVDHCIKYNLDINASLEDILEPIKKYPEQVVELTKIENSITKNGRRSKRLALIKKYGYDVKCLYHLIRLVDECQQLLEKNNMDITQSKNHLKAIRNGEWTLDQGKNYFKTKLLLLEKLYTKSRLPYEPNFKKIKELLLECIEIEYGSLQKYYNDT